MKTPGRTCDHIFLCDALVDRPTQPICISELAVVTPVVRRNFVSVVPAAKKKQAGSDFFLSKYPCYKQTVCEKARNGEKTGKNIPKKVFFLNRSI